MKATPTSSAPWWRIRRTADTVASAGLSRAARSYTRFKQEGRLRRFAIALILVSALAGAIHAAEEAKKIDPEKEKQIRTLLDLTGMTALVQSMTDQIFDSFERNFPDVKPEAWQRLRKKMPAEELIELVIPVYDRYYTTEDLTAVVEFYRTPVGQKVIRTLPDITRESSAIGERWGAERAEEVLEELKAEGLLNE
jgi:hypothetical protein